MNQRCQLGGRLSVHCVYLADTQKCYPHVLPFRLPSFGIRLGLDYQDRCIHSLVRPTTELAKLATRVGAGPKSCVVCISSSGGSTGVQLKVPIELVDLIP